MQSAATWREFLKDLKKRGLEDSRVILGVMDGLTGLGRVFKEEFPKAKVQRYQVYGCLPRWGGRQVPPVCVAAATGRRRQVARNVLAKVPGKLKKTVADDLRSIF